ncbi:efflux RND transporter permease subunit [Halovenus marina]|uniref:efflux RND transporter permease subunit n=1 Tax=Halovenus marina TaxID=3396621 RepID=UPI003F57428C
MKGSLTDRYAEIVTSRSKSVIALMLVVTVLVGAGIAVGETGETDLGEFDVDTEQTRAGDYVEANYPSEERIVSQVVVRSEGGNVLTRESIRAGLELQQAARSDGAIGSTLAPPGFAGIENIIGTVAYYEVSAAAGEPTDERPTLTEQIEALDALDEYESLTYEGVLERALDPDSNVVANADPYDFLPAGYEPGSTTAEARLALLFQVDDGGEDAVPERAYAAQVALDDMVDERFADAFVFGQGVNEDASSRATGDSFAIITPVALAFVLFVLGVAYRDVLDILLAFVGIAVVLVWLGGIMGWLSIPMNVILIAVPFLLIGLSIDYALHVVMRYREARAGRLDVAPDKGDDPEGGDGASAATSDRPPDPDRAIRRAMALGLGSVVLALGAATFSTGVGFFSNTVSPLPAIRDFALLSSGGILATFLVFAVLLPALKVELDSVIERRLGRSRAKPAFGVGRGVVNSLLSGVARLASRSPLAVIVVALLLTAGGAYGATTIDTEFNQADFLPQDAPEWTEYLPGPLEPGTYTIADDFAYLSDNFGTQGPDRRAQILIRESVTDGQVLAAIDSVSQSPAGRSVVVRADGRAAIEGPHTVLRSVAADNETLAAAIDERDTSGNGLPDENVTAVYDLLFEVDESAAENVLSREDGRITSARLLVSVRGGESAQQIAADTEALADAIESDAPMVSAVATGGPVTEAVFQDALLENLVQAFTITLVVILVFLVLLFWRQYGSPSLGPVVLAPVVAALAWLLGAMALLGISFNSETAVITSLAIGLGVDYSIHAGERFMVERERTDSLDDALEASITGTGGALLASAGTTAAGFGVLALSLSPPLQRFGLVTGSAIVLALIASVTVLPCLLVVRERIGQRYE